MNKIEEDVKAKLLLRGFSLKTMLNNRGIISAVVEETTEVINKNSICQNVSNSALIDAIEDTEIMIPIDSLFDENGGHITKQQYGKVLIERLVAQLRSHYC